MHSQHLRAGLAIVALACPWLFAAQAQAAAPTQGLVGYWKFDESSGTAAADSSGNNNNGVVSGAGATWAAGRIGGGLSFNGSSGSVTVPNASSINFTGSFTLTAWVRPSALSGYETVLNKGATSACTYWLQTSGARVSGGISTSSSCGSFSEHLASSPTLAVNTWYHLTAVYDSVARTYKVFLNGSSILSQAEAAQPAQTSEALVFGQSPCSSCSYERWRGLLDEIRAYNRPLSNQEVLDVYNDLGAPPAPDSQPPTVPSGLTATPASSTQVNLAWNAATDNVGVAGYHVYRNGTSISTTTATNYSDVGRSPSTTYSYTVDAFDAAGNVSAASASVPATTFAPPVGDSQAPSVNLTAPAAGVVVSGASVNLAANATDNVGVTAVQFLLDGQPLGSPDSTAPFSRTWDTTTAASGPHSLSATASDAAGNQGSAVIVTVTVDNQAPTGTVSINDGASATNSQTVTLRLAASDTQTAVAQMRFSNTAGSYSSAEAMAPTKTWTLSTGSGTKTVYAQFADAAGNWSTAATDTIVLDTTSPTLSSIASSSINASGATISWVSNETATSRVDYGPTTSYGQTTPLDPTLVTNHTVVLGGLNGGTLYNYRVRSIDAAGNEALGGNQTFTTTSGPDSTPPAVSLTAPANGAIVAATVTVSATATDSVGVTAVQFLLDGQPLGSADTTAPFSRTWDTTTATSGPHSLSATASDAAGNQGSAVIVTVTVDRQAPTGTVSINDGASATNNRNVTLRLSASDGQTSVTQMRFSNTAGSYSTAEAMAATKTWTLSTGTGTKTVYAQFADAAGNWSSAATDTIVVDTTSPTLSSIASSGISASGATISWVSSETATSRVDYGPTTSYGQTTPLDPTLVTNHTVVLGGLNSATLYNYRVRSIDAAGNETLGSNRSFTTSSAPDTTPPTVSVTQPAPDSVLSGSVTLAANAADNRGVSGVRFLVDGQPLGAEDLSSPYTVAWDTTTATNESHVVSAVARDAAGNQTTSAPVTITVSNIVDTEAPSVPSDVVATAASTSSIVVTWSPSTDNVGTTGYRVYRDGSLVSSTAQTSYTDSGLATLTTYSYTVAAYDAAVNVSAPSSPASGTTLDVTSFSYPLKLSGDGRYLVDQNQQPFLMNGDSAWSLIAQLSRENAEIYLESRRQKGFNLVLVNLLEHTFATNAPSNIYGDRPFLTAGNFNTPNEAYFAHADWVIDRAAEKGLVVLLAPLYLGYQCGSEGWCGEVKSSSLATIRSWGRYVGSRYQNRPNIIWVIGADADPVSNGVASKMREFVAGLRENDTQHLITAHNAPEQAARDPWPNEAWLDLNNIYTYGNTYSKAVTNYSAVPAKPFFLIESAYENENGSTPLSLRAQAYWTVLSGGVLGHVFGNCQIWGFGRGFCTSSWQAQLNSTGSTTLPLVGKLLQSRAFFLLVPDLNHSVLTAGYQSGSTYATAARASDGSTVMAFIPTQRTVTMDMTKVAGTSAKAWWYNPRTGSATLAGTFPTTGTRTFAPPDANDWVLVIDDASRILPPPGS